MSEQRQIIDGRKTARSACASGIAIMQVVCVVGVASVLALAMLSSGVLQTKMASNRTGGMQADVLADSALSLALYYVENPSAAPVKNADGYWPGEQNISFGAEVPGSADVTVVRTANNAAAATYTVTATGKTAEDLTHTARATVRWNKGFPINRAVSFNADAAVNTNLIVAGSVQCKGALTLPLNHSIAGPIFAVTTTGVVGTTQGKNKVSATSIVIPTAYTINTYRTYTYGGRTYRAKPLPTNVLNQVTLGPTSDNPAGVFIYSRDTADDLPYVCLGGRVTINGTLIVDNAVLYLFGPDNVITAAPGFPALIASKDVTILGEDSARAQGGLIGALVDLLRGLLGLLGGLLGGGGAVETELTVNGVVWCGESLRATADAENADVRITGALMFGGSGSVPSSLDGTVRVTYDATRALAPDIDTRYTSGAQIMSWGR